MNIFFLLKLDSETNVWAKKLEDNFKKLNNLLKS